MEESLAHCGAGGPGGVCASGEIVARELAAKMLRAGLWGTEPLEVEIAGEH